MAIEHAPEHELPERPAAPQIGEQSVVEQPVPQLAHGVLVATAPGAHLLVDIRESGEAEALFESVSTVHDQCQPAVSAQGPQRLPALVVEGREIGMGGESGHVHPGELVIGDPRGLAESLVEVEALAHRANQQQTVGVRAEGVEGPPVVRPDAGVDDIWG